MSLCRFPPLNPSPARSLSSIFLLDRALSSLVVVPWGFVELLRSNLSNLSFTSPKPIVRWSSFSLFPLMTPFPERPFTPVLLLRCSTSSLVVISWGCVERLRSALSSPSCNSPEPKVMDLLKPPPVPPDPMDLLLCSRFLEFRPSSASQPLFHPPSLSSVATVDKVRMLYSGGVPDDNCFNLRSTGLRFNSWAWPTLNYQKAHTSRSSTVMGLAQFDQHGSYFLNLASWSVFRT